MHKSYFCSLRHLSRLSSFLTRLFAHLYQDSFTHSFLHGYTTHCSCTHTQYNTTYNTWLMTCTCLCSCYSYQRGSSYFFFFLRSVYIFWRVILLLGDFTIRSTHHFCIFICVREEGLEAVLFSLVYIFSSFLFYLAMER